MVLGSSWAGSGLGTLGDKSRHGHCVCIYCFISLTLSTLRASSLSLLEKEMATHSIILAWRIPWTEEPGRLQSMGSQRVGHD